MKKKITIAVIFVCGILVFFVPYFFSNSWRNVELKREVIQSDIYERKDVEHAMTLVEHTFSQELQECKMTRISYDESAYRQFVDGFKKQKSDEVMVIYTDFITVSNVFHAGDHTLEPNAEYTAYPWVLRRSSAQKEWTIIGSGYGFLYT